MDLKNKVAIVTGGTKGIGEAISIKFAEQGAFVHILDIDESAAEQLALEIQHKKSTIEYHYCDVADYQQVQAVISGILQKGKIDILVNNAGISHIGTIETTSEDDIDQLISINVKGVINCTKACIKSMKDSGGGVILNMASIAASVGLSDRFAYSMTKGAVLAMTYSIAKDFLSSNIRCNSISPARIHTSFVDGFLKANYPGKEKEMFVKLSESQPIGRMGKPGEVADLACFLCSDKASFISGTDYPIDGGFLKLNT